jgi:hypothetical protein
MLEKAHERVAKEGLTNVELGDGRDQAEREDNSFDGLRAVRDQRRAGSRRGRARDEPRPPPGWQEIILNHFRSTNPVVATLER